MKNLCLKIVKYKLEIDEILKKKHDKFSSVDPIAYGKEVFPFWDDVITKRETAASVNCHEVVGGNFRNYTKEDQSINACKQLNSSASKGFGAPSYHKVAAFPIYFAGEGKNRVSLFKKHNLNITADIKYTDYPSADSLKIHCCYFRKMYFISCADNAINGSEKIVQIVFPELTIPLLEAYGVEYGSKLFKPFTFNSRNKVLKYLHTRLLRQ